MLKKALFLASFPDCRYCDTARQKPNKHYWSNHQHLQYIPISSVGVLRENRNRIYLLRYWTVLKRHSSFHFWNFGEDHPALFLKYLSNLSFSHFFFVTNIISLALSYKKQYKYEPTNNSNNNNPFSLGGIFPTGTGYETK